MVGLLVPNVGLCMLDSQRGGMGVCLAGPNVVVEHRFFLCAPAGCLLLLREWILVRRLFA